MATQTGMVATAAMFLCTLMLVARVGAVDLQVGLEATSLLLGANTVATVTMLPPPAISTEVWPFLDGLQWGATCNVTAGSSSCEILLPFPNAGVVGECMWLPQPRL